MDFNDVKVMVGSAIYVPNYFDFEQTSDDYPRIVVDVTLHPRNYHRCTPPNNISNPTIKDVIFNPPATIVFWSDNTKTVVKCDTTQEVYDPEKGIAMAMAKKLYGENKYEYYNTFLHWLKKYDKQVKEAASKTISTKGSWSGNMCDCL